MSKSIPRAIHPPVVIADLVGSAENTSGIPDPVDVLLTWRACRLDDDPASAAAHAPPGDSAESLIRTTIRRISGGSLDEEEARQEAWLVHLTWKAVDGLGWDQDDMPARVVVIIRNHLADLGRRARRRQAESLTTDVADLLVGREDDPADAYERCRIRAMVREILDEARDRISETSHRIILLRGIDGCSYEEIAEILGLPVARVRDRHRRAMSYLRDLFSRRFATDPSDYCVAIPETEKSTLFHREVKP